LGSFDEKRKKSHANVPLVVITNVTTVKQGIKGIVSGDYVEEKD
jgi:hypothetical protein